jgi:hypothetical protein
VAGCLKDPKQHQQETAISSDCTDFIALNVACAETMSKHCEEAFFSRDTVLCLTKWVDEESMDPKCAKVMKWAIPKPEEGVTDELGMSEKDYAEKQAWRENRKKARQAAVERVKESDAYKEQEQRELEKLKQEDPEAYEERIRQKEVIKKQNEEQRKKERLHAAALDRKRREDAKARGEDVDEEEEEKKAKAAERARRAAAHRGVPEKTNWLPYVLGGLFVAFIFFNVLNMFTKDKEEEKDD